MTGYEALRADAAWIDLSKRGKIRVTGEDRARLLHGMCTNHVQGLMLGEGLYAFFLTAQGKIIADACIYHLGDSLLLDTEPETTLKLIGHLDKFIIADDVTLEDESTQWAAIGVAGPNVADRLRELGIPFPEKIYSVQNWDEGFVARVAGTGPVEVRIFVPNDHKAELIRRLEAAGIRGATGEEARVVRLENGIPRYGDDITERNLVQEAEAMHAVHLNKGCYLGQEIVERVRSRAQVHRHLKAIRIGASVPPVAGTKLLAGGKEVGEITSAEYSLALGEVTGLAYVRTEAIADRLEMVVEGTDPLAGARLF